LIDGLSNKKPVALSWIYTQHENRILDAVYALSHAKNLDDFYKGVGLIHAPGLNVMYGDAKNNIAWITAGKLYMMDKTVNPNFILNGANGADDKKEFLDFKDNPAAINPPWHYVYSSNNQTEAISGYLYPGYYLPKDRAQRIESLLQSKNSWTKKDVSNMILDNTSSTAPEIVSNWLPTIAVASASANEQKAVAILKQWKGTNSLNDVAPTIYSKWVYFYLKNTFQDELGADNFTTFLGTHIMKQIIGPQSANEQSPWWDNVKSKNRIETRKAVLSQSFHQAIALLEKQLGNDAVSWTWNKVNVLELNHPMGKVKALRGFFNVGPFEVPGANEVINNMIFTYSDNTINEVRSGPSTRRIIDFSDVENSWSILPSGQSGNPMSRHYDDQAELFAQGKFRKMKLNKQEIIRTSTKLVLKPGL
jgi:penicillin amidase